MAAGGPGPVIKKSQVRTPTATLVGEKLILCFLLATLAPNMDKTKCRGARDLSVVKVSALYDPWRSKKHRKTTIAKIVKISIQIVEIKENMFFQESNTFLDFAIKFSIKNSPI
jgi:hypothetical protein